MKYMILTFASQEHYQEMTGLAPAKAAWTPEDYAALGAFMREFSQELIDSGELVETRGLSAPVHSRRVRLQQAHQPRRQVRGAAVGRCVAGMPWNGPS